VSESYLNDIFAGFAHERDDGDWHDVVRRARRSHRNRVVIAAVAAAVVAVGVASAVVLTNPRIDFRTASKSPLRVVDDFGSEQVLAPPGMAPGVLPQQARRITAVTIDGKQHVLYVAPTKAGGFCEQWSQMGGGCRASRTGPASNSIGGGGMGGPNGLTVLDGSFFQTDATRLVVGYADGESDDVPFVWVTKPIDAGFYLFRVPDAHRRAGHEPTSLSLYNTAGKLIARDRVIVPNIRDQYVHHRIPGYPPFLIPAKAGWSKRVQLFALRADNGNRIGLWVAPERGGGTCFWSNRQAGCSQLRGPGFAPGFLKAHPGLRLQGPLIGFGLSGGNPVILCCSVGTKTTRVELRFQDGTPIELTPKQGYLIEPIPSSHYPLGHRLTAIVAYDAAGRVLGTKTIGPSPGVYPCTKPQHLAYNVTRCP
jgi:hypothetical protein